MDIKPVVTSEAPLPVGPYSQAVWCGSQLFISGQIPLDPASGSIAGDAIERQARQALDNLCAILGSQGLGVEKLVKTTVYLSDIGYYPVFNSIYESVLGSAKPARSVVAVAGLPKNVLVEIEAVACR